MVTAIRKRALIGCRNGVRQRAVEICVQNKRLASCCSVKYDSYKVA